MDMYRELQGVTNELQNVLSAANIASEESQKVALRLEMMEKEWLLWTEGQYTEAPEPEQANAEEAGPGRTQPQELRVVARTPGGSPRLPEEAQFEDLLGLELEEDPLLQWWDAAAPQEGQNHNMAPLPLGAPQAIALGAGVPQPGVHGMASAGVPPRLRAGDGDCRRKPCRKSTGGSTSGYASAAERGWPDGVMPTPFPLLSRVWCCQVSRLGLR